MCVSEKYKIYVFSVLSHGVSVGIAFLIIYLVRLAWPEFGPFTSSPSWPVYFFLIYWGTGFILVPFFNPYERSYRYFFQGERDKKDNKQEEGVLDQ